MKNYETFIHKSRYARWLDDEQRRETWEETVDRYFSFIDSHLTEFTEGKLSKLLVESLPRIREAVLNKEVMPSMRALMTAGPALQRDHVAGYNCAYLTISNQRAFDKLFYILLCGTGVGYSVERQYINKLPQLPEEFHETTTTIHVRDSKIGWATSLRELVSLLYSGQIPQWDMSKVRPAGARLKTFGGRASGPEPLDRLFRQIIRIITAANGRKLNSLEVHDICCHIADAVVVGGVRRAALISLSNLTDQRMRSAKAGEWWNTDDQRALANNSVAYTEKPSMNIFMEELKAIYDSKSGERGIFNRNAAASKAAEGGRRESSEDFGCNPCSEIILRDKEFCNLTEVIVRPDDGADSLRRKVEAATILGTIQSTLTNFRYLDSKWKENCEEERLLGVSLTGVMDHPLLNGTNLSDGKLAELLSELKQTAISTNKKYAGALGINQSAAITCIKPSGTVSQLVGCSSGIHAAIYPHYIRTVRNSIRDPLTQFLVDQEVPHELAVRDPSTMVFSFPMKASDTALFVDDLTALDQLELWKLYNDYWCEHKPSCTIHVKDHEWLEVGAWVYNHFDEVSGISFLPHDDHIYRQAPYQRITVEEYNKKIKEFPEIDWSKFDSRYESSDNTTSSQEYACVGTSCDIT